MGVTYIAPAGTVTSPAKLITKNITDNGTYDAADDLANGYSQVVVNVKGGGGSSDFSTAEVTVVANDFFEMYGAFLQTDGTYFSNGYMDSPLTLALYKGKAYIVINETVASTSGDITYDSETELYIVTGDCTITIS